MTITSNDLLIAAARQSRIPLIRNVSRTAVALSSYSVFDLAGDPGAGTLAGTSTAAGVVPTSATAGCPIVNAYGGGAVAMIPRLEFNNSVACRMALYDMVFKAGAYAFTAGTTTLSAQPSYSSRMAGGTDYTGTEIWIEVSTAFATGTAWQVQVTYTNQAGTTGRTSIISVARAAAALTLGTMFRMALQAGDSGVQKIESVIVINGGTAMTAGNFNVLVLRGLGATRIRVANDVVIQDQFATQLPFVGASPALVCVVTPDSTATGLPEVYIDIANG